MRMGKKPQGVRLKPPAFGPLAAEVRRRRKPKPRRVGLLFLMVAALAAIGGSATLAARTWPNAFSLNTMFSLTAAKKPEPAPPSKVGHIIVTHSNSARCDHFLFDNKSGGMRALEASSCGGKREDVKTVDQVQSFSSSWRGAR
jgi:hypothetical protein